MSAAAGAHSAGRHRACAPLLVGSIQVLKARLQGRHGPSALQPYRTLVRLWGKSAVDPEGTGPLYRLAPALIAACLLVAVAIVPIAGHAGGWGLGNDALVLVGVLALARFALAAAAWDTGNAFALMASCPGPDDRRVRRGAARPRAARPRAAGAEQQT